MLCCTRKEWARASFWFALACMFRSNGIFLSGYIIWGLVVQPVLQSQWVWTLSSVSSFSRNNFLPAWVPSSAEDSYFNCDNCITFCWIPGLRIFHILHGRQEGRCAHVVLRLSSVDLHPCAIEVLGRRLHAILDSEPATQLRHCSSNSVACVCFRIASSSTHTCGGPYTWPQEGWKGTCGALRYFPEHLHHTLCSSCLGFCFPHSLHVAYTDYPSSCGFVASRTLGCSMVIDGTSILGTFLDFLERSLGGCITFVVGYIPSASLNFTSYLEY